MEGLPVLPGFNFNDPTKRNFHLSHNLGFKNGYRTTKTPETGIGGDPVGWSPLSEQELDELANYRPTLTYGQMKQAPPSSFVPAHVALDKKVLRFHAYFKETIYESPQEYFRVRPIDIYYFLEDDSIAVYEPAVDNSGIPQGKFIRRHRIPKNEFGEFYHWKDLNLAKNITFYGRVFRICKCDLFTKNYLESEGVEVAQPEEIPTDQYISKRQAALELPQHATPSPFDKLKQFLEMDRKVLRLFAVWDDRDQTNGDVRPYLIHYYLVDDTMEVREMHEPNDGRDLFPVLIKRSKIPKNRDQLPTTFPLCYMEPSEREYRQAYFTPADLKIGATLVLYGRKFLIYDVDNFTKAWYYQNFGVTDFEPLPVKGEVARLPKMELPPHTSGIGSYEDSLGSFFSLEPAPPRQNFIKQIENEGLVLRWEASLDSVRPEDATRRFIISYQLADDLVNIYEKPTRNSGHPAGMFLHRSRMPKPNFKPEKPEYYGPADFAIGATIEAYGSRFVIVNADAAVLTYMEQNPEHFPPQVIESVKQKLASQDNEANLKIRKELHQVKVRNTHSSEEGALGELVRQLKRLAITDRERCDHLFLKYTSDHSGALLPRHVVAMCRGHQIPVDESIAKLFVERFGTDGKLNLEQFRLFFDK